MKYTKISLLFCIVFNYALFAQGKIQDPRLTEVWGPVPAQVEPGKNNAPPSDAVILFDGNDLSAWTKADDSGDAEWDVENGILTVKPGTGAIRTRNAFGDCQLHIEWRTPQEVKGKGQGRGNSGVFLMGRYEIQVLDSWDNRTYANGQAGSVYKQHIPLVNASLPPGEWQSYDIVFMAPRFASDGELEKPATITVFQNGVLIQNHVELKGPSVFIGYPSYSPHPERLPIQLQDHNNSVSYRNIWIRDL